MQYTYRILNVRDLCAPIKVYSLIGILKEEKSKKYRHNRDNRIFAIMSKRSLLLFDIDGTLALSTQKIPKNLKDLIISLKKDCDIGLVGGSAFTQHKYQLGDDIHDVFDYVFSENGVMAFRKGEMIHCNDIRKVIPEERMTNLIDHTLRYIADLKLPKKRGKFIDFRRGLIYVTSMGSNCDRKERYEFIDFDKKNNIRSNMIKRMKEKFGDIVDVKTGGQIGLGYCPKGWNKSYCLQHFNRKDYEKVHFFGDQTEEDGNDYPLYSHPDIIGYSVDSPEDTFDFLSKL